MSASTSTDTQQTRKNSDTTTTKKKRELSPEWKKKISKKIQEIRDNETDEQRQERNEKISKSMTEYWRKRQEGSDQ